MAIQGIGGVGGLNLSFRQNNFQVDRLGEQATAIRMHESNPHVSNAGNETNLGTSHFQQENEELIETSVDRVAAIMERDDEYMEVSNTGSEAPASSTGFQEVNDTSADRQQQLAVAARAYSYFNE